MSSAAAKKNKKLTFSRTDTKCIKAFALFLMLWHHLFAFPERIHVDYNQWLVVGGVPLDQMIGSFGKICVALFLFVGGVGTYYTVTKQRSDKKKNSTVVRKAAGLYAAFWRVFLVVVPISYIFHTKNAVLNVNEVALNFFGIEMSFCGEWWFLTPYIVLTLASPIIVKIISKQNNQLKSVIIATLYYLLTAVCLPFLLKLDIFDTPNMVWADVTLALRLSTSFIVGCLFARYDWLSKIKDVLGRNYIYSFLAFCLLPVMVWMRHYVSDEYDCIYAIATVICLIAILSMPIMKYPKKLLAIIGAQSTNMWLLHSIFCYDWMQGVIFWPHEPILIFILLVVVSFLAGLLLDYFWKALLFIWCKLNLVEKLQFSPQE